MARRKRESTGGKPTIFDVAQRAGVSIKTVSRVVNHEDNVRENTRERVLAAIADLDYQPNAAARGLSSKRSYVIGLIYENADEFSYMKHVLDGALAACEAQGYTLLLRPLTLPNDELLSQIRAFAVQARVDGVLLPAPIGDIDGVVDLLKELDVPFATVTPKTPKPEGINVFCDDAQASQDLASYLIEQGHKRIGFILGHPDHRATEQRYKGYRQALKAHGIRYDAALVRKGLFTFESGQQAAAQLLSLDTPPTAIMASNDDMAAGVSFHAHERGLDVPGDLSVVGFDDTPVASHMWPPLTTARQPISNMVEAAVNGLVRQLRGEEGDLSEAPFHCEVVIRRSTGAVL